MLAVATVLTLARMMSRAVLPAAVTKAALVVSLAVVTVRAAATMSGEAVTVMACAMVTTMTAVALMTATAVVATFAMLPMTGMTVTLRSESSKAMRRSAMSKTAMPKTAVITLAAMAVGGPSKLARTPMPCKRTKRTSTAMTSTATPWTIHPRTLVVPRTTAMLSQCGTFARHLAGTGPPIVRIVVAASRCARRRPTMIGICMIALGSARRRSVVRPCSRSLGAGSTVVTMFGIRRPARAWLAIARFGRVRR